MVDGVGAAAFGIGALAIAGDSAGAALVSALVGALFFGAAFHGNSVVDDCNRELGLYATESVAPVVVEQPPTAVAHMPSIQLPVRVEPAPQPESEKPAPPPVTPTIESPWKDFWRVIP